MNCRRRSARRRRPDSPYHGDSSEEQVHEADGFTRSGRGCGRNSGRTMQDTIETRGATQYAVIGRSENYPTLYHMNQTSVNAERLRARREAATGRPCYVVTML